MGGKFTLRSVFSIQACCIGLLLMPVPAFAQQPGPPAAPAPALAAPEQESGFFANVGRWLNRQSSNLQVGWQNLTAEVHNFSREAGIAAQTGADTATQAANTMAKLRNVRVVTGYQRCDVAPNGAPDCGKAVAALCKAQGFETGTSLDMTTAEDCPVKVYLSGRKSGPECTGFTFVSRALCQ